MSIFGSISGFFSAIGRTGSDSNETGSLSESLSESSSSIQSVTESGSRRTSAVSLAGPQGPSVAPILDTPDVDLSHLSEDERAQIAAVIARAKTLQTLDDLTAEDTSRRPAGTDQQPINSDRLIDTDSEYVIGNEKSADVPAICRPPDDYDGEATSGSGCAQTTCLSSSSGRSICRSEDGDQVLDKTFAHVSKTFQSTRLPSSALHETGTEETRKTEPEVDDTSAFDKTPPPALPSNAGSAVGKAFTYGRTDCAPSSRSVSTPGEAELQSSPTDFSTGLDDSEIESPSQRGSTAASHRPKDLLLSNLSSLSSSTDSLPDTTSWSSDGGGPGCCPVEPKSTSEPQLAGAGGDRHPEEAIVSRPEPRCRSRSFDGADRKRPTGLGKDRGGGDRNQSPSRRSPKSPPRSPSWMRLRESPTRTGCHRTTRSPQVSPSEKYPMDDPPHHTGLPCSDEFRDYEAYLDERRNPGLEGTTEGRSGTVEEDSDGVGGVGHSSIHLGNPFFTASGYEAARDSIDLASFAATVASGTAHLTSMSFSPPRPEDAPTTTATTGGDGSEEVEGIPNDARGGCSEEEDQCFSATVATVDNSTGDTDHTPRDIAGSPEDLLFVTSSLTVGGGWLGRLDLSPIPDVSSSAESETVDRVPSHMILRRTHSNEDQGSVSYGARCIAETSPTFGSFRRCPSYHNILSLPELEKSELSSAKLPDQTVAIRDERNSQSTGSETTPLLPKLTEEQEHSTEEDFDETEKRERALDPPLRVFFPDEYPPKSVTTTTAAISPSRGQGLFVAVTDRTRRSSFGSDGEESSASYGSSYQDNRNSSMGNALTADVDEQVFLSDEELREIDLDEELPPKHLIVRRPRKCAPPPVLLSTDSPTGDIIALSPADDDVEPGRWKPDEGPLIKDSVMDVVEQPLKSGSRRKLPPVPGNCDAPCWPSGSEVETREGLAKHPGDMTMEEIVHDRCLQPSGFPAVLHSTGKPGDSASISDTTIRKDSDLVGVRTSPLTKHRSKSNDEKATVDRSTSALKPRSVSADDKQVIKVSIPQELASPKDVQAASVDDIRQQPQTVSSLVCGEQISARNVDRSVVIRNTGYNGSAGLRNVPHLQQESSSGTVTCRGDDSAKTVGTGSREVSSTRSENQSTANVGMADVTKTLLVREKETGAMDKKASDHPYGIRLRPKVPPKPSRLRTDETGLAMVATVSLKHGLEVPVSVHGLQQRVRDEVKIVTATRRLRLDEAEEIRILEAEFAERSKERRLKEAGLRLKEAELRHKEAGLRHKGAELGHKEAGLLRNRFSSTDRGSWSDEEGRRERESAKASCCGRMEEMLNYEDPESRRAGRSVSVSSTVTPATSKQPRRPSSDPLFAKFSPIEEDGDDETSAFLSKTQPSDVHRQYASLDRQSMGHPIRLGTAVLTGYKTLTCGESQRQLFLSKSTLVLHGSGGLLPESSSLVGLSATSLSKAELVGDDDDSKGKEERLQFLQTEIEKRRRHLSEMAQRGVGPVTIVRESFNTDPSRGRRQREEQDSPSLVSSSRHLAVSSGLIKPIDYQINPENYYVRSQTTTGSRCERVDPRTQAIMVHGGGGEQGVDPISSTCSVYSSFEYLTHKTECAQKTTLPENVEDLFPSDTTVYQGDYGQPSFSAAPVEKDIIRYSESEDSLLYCPGNYGSSRDSGVSSSMTGPDLYAFRSDRESTPPHEDYRTACCYQTQVSSSSCPSASMMEYYQQREAVAAAVAGGPTPAMPLLGDVTSRSRSLLRDIGSRPLSDDLEKYFQAAEPSSQLCRDDSDYSVTDSTDDYIMEGGVTIRLNCERKAKRSVTTPRKYPFPTKRILLTSDPKERSSRGFGVKIIGGQYLPWAGDQLCAYVAYIFPGSVADQIHGELQEGDQVLELNGETLSGKTNEEVNLILDSCNCEVELVVRHGLNLRTFRSITMSTINTDSNRSSYDNMATASSFEESIDGLDRDSTRLTSSNQRVNAVPPISSSSHHQQQQYPVSQDFLPQGIVPLQRSSSSTADFKRKVSAREDSPAADECDKYVGEIQLQLSYDDYDGTLNVHVIQARNLRPKYKTGYTDPFVKIYLLPYRSRSECKRRTRFVARTLNPEWHRTLVFLNIAQQDLPSKTIDLSVWDHDRFMPNQFIGELLIDLSDNSYLDNRPHWYRLTEEDSDNRYGKRPRTGTMSSSDSAQSSSSSRSRRPDREGPSALGLGRREDQRGPTEHRPTTSDSPYRYPGTRRTLSDSEESIAKRSDLKGASSARELCAAPVGGQSGGQYKSDQQLTGVASSGGRQDIVPQHLEAYTDESWTDFSDRGHGLAFSREQMLGSDRGQGQGLGCDSRSHDENTFENRSKMAATLHCLLTAIFCCLRSSASGAL